MNNAVGKLEVHEHWYITGPAGRRLVHAHEGGDRPHEHVNGAQRLGPAAYTIDKDEWLRRTGMVGGGRKKFVAKPVGDQLPLVAIEPSRIDIVIVGDGGAAAARGAHGPGLSAVDRMVLAFGAQVATVTHVPSRRRAPNA